MKKFDTYSAVAADPVFVAVERYEDTGRGPEVAERIADVYVHDGDLERAEEIAGKLADLLNEEADR